MRQKLFVFLLFLIAFPAVNSFMYGKNSEVPDYYKSQLKKKTWLIKKDSKKCASFIYVTDTHVNSNGMHSPLLIRHLLDNTDVKTVIWGGDAISTYGDNIDEQWEKQLQFDSILNGACNIYKVRGNHDFMTTIRKGQDEGYTYSNEKTAELLMKGCPANIHRNATDKGGCYYYFDDEKQRIRFIILDTNDSVTSENIPRGNIVGVHNRQLQWVADSALSTTPEEYGLIFVSHIPIATDIYPKKYKFDDVRKLIEGTASRSKGETGGVRYDFSRLKDVKVLMCIAGHLHRDSHIYINGILYVTIPCDAAIEKVNRKYTAGKSYRKFGTINEQCFDCFCIDREKNEVNIYRIGFGVDRHFRIQ